MPSDAPVAAVSEPAAKTPWPGQDDDDDDDEEEEEEGDAFGFEDGMDTLGEMHGKLVDSDSPTLPCPSPSRA